MRPVTSNTGTERCTPVDEGSECCHLVWVKKQYLLERKAGYWQEAISDGIILKSLILKIVQKQPWVFIESVFCNHQPNIAFPIPHGYVCRITVTRAEFGYQMWLCITIHK